MTLAIAAFTFIPPLADLVTNTNVFHPDGAPHARVHTVWLLGLTSSLGLVALYLLWFRRADIHFNQNFAAILGAIVYGSFFLSSVTANLYGGALSDNEGGIEQTIMGLNLNVFTFGLAWIALGLGWLLCNRGKV
jgi:hypothetical protein